MNPSSTIIASSGVFQIEYLIETLEKDFDELISVSKSLKKIYGARSVLTKNTIRKYLTILNRYLSLLGTEMKLLHIL